MARSRLSPGCARRASACWVLLGCLSGCSGDFVSLGSTEPLQVGGDAGSAGVGGGGGNPLAGGTGGVWTIGPPVLTQERTVSFANGTFTDDVQQLFFTRQSRVDDDDAFLFRARAIGSSFGGERELLIDGAKQAASSPAISLEGEELWFGAAGDTSTDIFVSLGADDTWGAAALVSELNSDADDVPRPPGMVGTVMPLSSKRGDPKHYQIYLATREAGQAWQQPTQDLLGNVNLPDSDSVDGFLTENGLTLYFASTRLSGSTKADLFRATRATVEATFGEPEPLLGTVNTADHDERDPWLAPGGKRLFFTSNRSGEYAIYSAELLP